MAMHTDYEISAYEWIRSIAAEKDVKKIFIDPSNFSNSDVDIACYDSSYGRAYMTVFHRDSGKTVFFIIKNIGFLRDKYPTEYARYKENGIKNFLLAYVKGEAQMLSIGLANE